MLRRCFQVLATFLVMIAGMGTARADLAADRCAGSKMKAASGYADAVLACRSKAVKTNSSVDPLCLSRAAARLENTFGRAQDKGGCATMGDAASVEASLASAGDTVVAALAPDPTEEARACAAAKIKGAGKHIRAALGCYASRATVGSPPLATCFTKALSRLQPVFARAEGKGGCTTTSDLSDIQNLDNAAVRAQVAALSPVCGDGITSPTQQCETSDDGTCPGLCSPACACVAPPSCGNGVAELPEQCDDGALVGGDGCSAL